MRAPPEKLRIMDDPKYVKLIFCGDNGPSHFLHLLPHPPNLLLPLKFPQCMLSDCPSPFPFRFTFSCCWIAVVLPLRFLLNSCLKAQPLLHLVSPRLFHPPAVTSSFIQYSSLRNHTFCAVLCAHSHTQPQTRASHR